MNKWSLEKPVVAMPIIILLNTLAMIWVGGVEHFQEKTPLLSGLFFLILYIIVSEAWQLIGRNMEYSSCRGTTTSLERPACGERIHVERPAAGCNSLPALLCRQAGGGSPARSQ